MRLFFLLASASLLLAGCAPHPASGVWQAVDPQAPVQRLVLAFNGRALFATGTPPVEWHCFWSGRDAREASLACTAADRPKTVVNYRLVSSGDQADFYRGEQLLAHLKRIDANPKLPE